MRFSITGHIWRVYFSFGARFPRFTNCLNFPGFWPQIIVGKTLYLPQFRKSEKFAPKLKCSPFGQSFDLMDVNISPHPVVFTELPLAQNKYILRFTNKAIAPILKLNYYLMFLNNRLRGQAMK